MTMAVAAPAFVFPLRAVFLALHGPPARAVPLPAAPVAFGLARRRRPLFPKRALLLPLLAQDLLLRCLLLADRVFALGLELLRPALLLLVP